eukprot:g7487.t1
MVREETVIRAASEATELVINYGEEWEQHMSYAGQWFALITSILLLIWYTKQTYQRQCGWEEFYVCVIERPEGFGHLSIAGSDIAHTFVDMLSKNTFGMIGHFLRIEIRKHILKHGELKKQPKGAKGFMGMFGFEDLDDTENDQKISIKSKNKNKTEKDDDLSAGLIILGVKDASLIRYFQELFVGLHSQLTLMPVIGSEAVKMTARSLNPASVDYVLLDAELVNDPVLLNYLRGPCQLRVCGFGWALNSPHKEILEQAPLDGVLEGPSFGKGVNVNDLRNLTAEMQQMKVASRTNLLGYEHQSLMGMHSLQALPMTSPPYRQNYDSRQIQTEAETVQKVSEIPSLSVLVPSTSNWRILHPSPFGVLWTRHYKPKIYFRHDIMRNILAKFLDSKGVPKQAIENVISTKHYYALHKDEFEHFERVVVWLSTIGLHSGEDLGQILLKHPNFLWTDINILERGLLAQNPNLLFHHAEIMGHFVQALEMLKIDTLTIRRLLIRRPELLEHCKDVEELQSLIRWLTMTIGLSIEECRQIMLQVPDLMNPIHQQLLPKWYEYLTRIGLKIKDIQKVIMQNPHSLLIGATMVSKIARWLRKNFSLRQRAVARIIVHHPEVLSLDRDKIANLVQFLKKIGFSSDQRFSLILKLPVLLLKDVETELVPKIEFLQEKLWNSKSQIKEFPECLSYDLNFIKKRYGFLERYAQTHKLKLKDALQESDILFVQFIPTVNLEKYRQFENWWMIKST